jgi:putative ABC transport system ATP-binding protein
VTIRIGKSGVKRSGHGARERLIRFQARGERLGRPGRADRHPEWYHEGADDRLDIVWVDRGDPERHAKVKTTSRGDMSAQPLIQIRGLSKVFRTEAAETPALSNIHLDIRQGEYIAIAGPSGCGKTTLLSILGLLDTPTSGEYRLGGEPVAKLTAAQRAHIRNREIGFIFQAFNLIGDLTVYENVELPLTYRNMPEDERTMRAREALERVGMSHRTGHYPAQLSGGQQQRVAVARAIAGSPSVLLADEPTGNLDSANGEEVMRLLRELHHGGATIVMVTHDPRYEMHAQRSIHLFDGQIVSDAGGAHDPTSSGSRC